MPLRFEFRAEARRHLETAKLEFQHGGEPALRHAALHLRMAMEAIVYERVRAYEKELPRPEFQKWQPRQLMRNLLEVDPHAGTSSVHRAGRQTSLGEPATDMTFMGIENVLSLSDVRDNYDALGNFLHMPTLAQIEAGYTFDEAKLRERCEFLVSRIEAVLASTIHTSTFGFFSTLDCDRCGKLVSRRVTHLNEGDAVETQCFGCGAPYRVLKETDDKTRWTPLQFLVNCPHDECRAENKIWKDQVVPGFESECVGCKKFFRVNFGIYPCE